MEPARPSKRTAFKAFFKNILGKNEARDHPEEQKEETSDPEEFSSDERTF